MKDMIRENTPPSINKRIDRQTLEHLDRYEHATGQEIEARLKTLDKQWDIECFVELGCAAATLGGLALGFRNRRLLAIPAVAQALLLSHSLPFWDPLTPLFRAFGVWSRQEIERERHALKLLRGDYERVMKNHSPKSVLAVSQGEVGIKSATASPGTPGTRAEEKKPRRAGRGPRSEARQRRSEEVLGEELRPTDVPTVSGPSGSPETH